MNTHRKERLRARESGQGLVEFALVFSILVMLCCMATDTARVVDAKILLQSAACESARCINTRGDMSSEVSESLENDYDRLDSSRLQVRVTGGSDQRRNYVYHAHNGNFRYVERNCYFTYFDATVKLTYQLPIVTPFGQLFFGKQKTLSAGYTRMIVDGGYSW